MIDGIITVRSQSTRLPEKCFLPFGDSSVIEYVIKRAKYFDIDPIVCTTTETSDDRIAEISKRENVRYFRGSIKDKLLRWRDACRVYEIEKFVTIDADDPFFDGLLSYKSIGLLDKSFDLIKHPRQQPNKGYYEGCVGYSINLEIIEKACNLKNTDDTEMMWKFIENVNDAKIGYLEVDDYDIEFPLRLTLDYKEDYWLMCSILKMLSKFPSRIEILELFTANPDLYKVNWFRNDDYKAAQIARKIY